MREEEIVGLDFSSHLLIVQPRWFLHWVFLKITDRKYMADNYPSTAADYAWSASQDNAEHISEVNKRLDVIQADMAFLADAIGRRLPSDVAAEKELQVILKDVVSRIKKRGLTLSKVPKHVSKPQEIGLIIQEGYELLAAHVRATTVLNAMLKKMNYDPGTLYETRSKWINAESLKKLKGSVVGTFYQDFN